MGFTSMIEPSKLIEKAIGREAASHGLKSFSISITRPLAATVSHNHTLTT